MLYYETVEKNKDLNWVVFIHGLGGSILTWKKQIEDFSKEYNLLLIDLNGHGNSKDVSFFDPKDYSEICNNIKEILDKVGIQRANFIGMSLGAFVLVSYVIKYPQTVLSLILGGGVIQLEKSKLALLNLVQVIKRIIPSNLLYKIFSVVILPKKNHKKSREIFNREALKLKRAEFIAWLESLKQVKYADKFIEALNKLKEIPILYVMGSEDHMFLKGTAMAVEKIEPATLQIIEHCGHVCSIEKYKEFNDSALKFLKSRSV